MVKQRVSIPNGVGAFLILVFLVLAFRAWHPNRWSWWDFGDAQTMMAATVFRDEGFLKTHFLWVPQPSSPISTLMDDEPVRHHAHGTGGDAQFSNLGPKRMYTHWPSWYSVPYGILAQWGIVDKGIYQIWASLLSVLALFFFFSFLRNVADDEIAAIATVIYGLAPTFWGYADSLATMPYDDFFRMAFLWAWSARKETDGFLKRILVPGLIYFGGFLTSLDSFAFIPVVAFFSDLISKRKVAVKDLALLVTFGAGAMLVQWCQNASYLGLAGAWKDWTGYLGANGNLRFAHRIVQPLYCHVRSFNFGIGWVAVIALAALGFSFLYPRKIRGWWMTLALGGMAFAFFIPGKSPMDYEDRQVLPFAVLTYALIIGGLGQWLRHRAPRFGIKSVTLHLAVLYAFGMGLAAGNFYEFGLSRLDHAFDLSPRAHFGPRKTALFARIHQDIPNDKVFVQLGPVLLTKRFIEPGFGQVSPIEEWLTHGIVITVPDLHALARDLGYFWEKAPRPFHPILLTRVEKGMESVDDARLKALGIPWRLGQGWNEGSIYAYKLIYSPTLPPLARNSP